ncbi:MAG: CDP-alcohol phosphatidyltransferase family protein [Acidimicrobiales bacterium]
MAEREPSMIGSQNAPRSFAEPLVRLVPSLITLLRLLLLPVVVEFAHRDRSPWAVAVILAVMSVTDFLDGFVARRIGAVTTFGKVFDPVSDRIIVIALGIFFTLDHVLPLGIAIPLLIREVVISALVSYLALRYRHRVDVVFIGKAGTFSVLVALPLLVFHLGHGIFDRDLYDAGLVFAAAGTVVLYAAGVRYVRIFVADVRGSRRVPPETEEREGSTQ